MNVLEKILEEIDKLKEKCLLPELESGYAAESYRRPKKEKSSCKEHIMSRFMKVE